MDHNRIMTFLIFLSIYSVNYSVAATDSFVEYTDNSQFIGYRGNLPSTIDQEWKNSITNCWLDITKNIGPSYSEFDSSIVTVASDNTVLIMDIDYDYREEINDSRIDEMYWKIEEYCEQQQGVTNIPVVFMWDEDEEDLSLPDYGPEIFEKAANSSRFIAARGTMPVITDESEKRQWTDLLTQCARSNDKIDNYFVSSGEPVVSFGTSIDGYLEVGINSASSGNINDSVIDEIYQTIDEAAQEEGVSEVPVVFIWSGRPQTDEAVYDPAIEGSGFDNNESLEIPDNKTDEKEDESSQTTPGFTSIMLVLCLLILVKYRK